MEEVFYWFTTTVITKRGGVFYLLTPLLKRILGLVGAVTDYSF
jgi:hypothetical protein